MANEITKALKKNADFIANIKGASADENGTFSVIISTEDTDRHGEIVMQDGIDTERYMQNPVVLWGHNHNMPPIGITKKIYTEIRNGKKVTIADGIFSGDDFAQQIRRLYDAGIITATSIGFIEKEREGNTITASELLEFSFVSVPANPYALSLRELKELGIDTAMLQTKGLNIEIKEGEATEEPQEEEPQEQETEPTLKDVLQAVQELSKNINSFLETKQKNEQTEEETETEKETQEEAAEGDKVTDEGGRAVDESDGVPADSEASKEYLDWRKQKELLRVIATATTEALTKLNSRN